MGLKVEEWILQGWDQVEEWVHVDWDSKWKSGSFLAEIVWVGLSDFLGWDCKWKSGSF